MLIWNGSNKAEIMHKYIDITNLKCLVLNWINKRWGIVENMRVLKIKVTFSIMSVCQSFFCPGRGGMWPLNLTIQGSLYPLLPVPALDMGSHCITIRGPPLTETPHTFKLFHCEARTIDKQAVLILLKCFLVLEFFLTTKKSFQFKDGYFMLTLYFIKISENFIKLKVMGLCPTHSAKLILYPYRMQVLWISPTAYSYLMYSMQVATPIEV